MSKLLSVLATLVAALAIAPAAFGQVCADCDGGGGGGGGSGNTPPSAAFSYNPSSPKTGDAVTFTNSSTDPDGSIASSSWNFGDGSTSSAGSPTHAYSTSGTYTITLTVTDNGGATASTTKQITVANRPPLVWFGIPSVGYPGQAVSFTNTSTDPDGQIASYAWDFGDGGSSTAATPSHTYATAGTYTITLTVTDNNGAVGAASGTLRVNAAPTTQILVGSTQVAGEPTTFNSISNDSDGSVTSLTWNFGDGASATGAAPDHTYAAAGDYTVTLTAKDNDGSTGTATAVVHVSAPASGGDTGGGDNTGGGGDQNGGDTGGTGGGDQSGGGSNPVPVTSTGTPTPPAPGSTGDGPQVTPPPAIDTTAPVLTVPSKVKAKKKTGKFSLTVTTNEPATIVATLKGKAVKAKIARAGKLVVRLPRTAKKGAKLAVVVTATDAAGNKTTKTVRVVVV